MALATYQSSGLLKRVYVASVVFHLVGGAMLVSMDVPRPPAPVVIEMRTIEAPKAPPPPPPPPPPPKPPPRPPAEAKVAPPPAALAPTKSAAAPDFGLSLAGGLGGPAGPGGIAVPIAPKVAPPVRQAAARTLTAKAPTPVGEACTEEETKARAISLPHPSYTDEARQAEIEGKVRIELSIDGAGKVTNAKVLSPLGHGLDEAALAAVRSATFSPATRCGKPVPSTFVLAVRFAL